MGVCGRIDQLDTFGKRAIETSSQKMLSVGFEAYAILCGLIGPQETSNAIR